MRKLISPVLSNLPMGKLRLNWCGRLSSPDVPSLMPLCASNQTLGNQTRMCCGLGQAPIPRSGVPSRPGGSVPG